VVGVAFVLAAPLVLTAVMEGGMELSEYYRVARLVVGGALMVYLGRRLSRRRSSRA